MIRVTSMHHALRSSLLVISSAACIAASAGCQTHDRRIYTIHTDKNLHTPDPWTPAATSSSKAADDAAAALLANPQGANTAPAPSSNPVAPPPDSSAPMTPPAGQ